MVGGETAGGDESHVELQTKVKRSFAKISQSLLWPFDVHLA